MFKAKLIDKKEYYKLRSKQTLLLLLPSLPIAFLANFYSFPWWATTLALGVYVLLSILTLKNQKLMQSMLGQKIIEIDNNEIRIKSKNGNIKNTYQLAKLDKIILKNDYKIHQETYMDFKNEITGYPVKNFLTIEQGGINHSFDFELDSHYMIVQLNKVIENWSKKGINIEKVA